MFLNCSRLTRRSRTLLWKTRDSFSRGQKRPLYEGRHLDRAVWRRLNAAKPLKPPALPGDIYRLGYTVSLGLAVGQQLLRLVFDCGS
jgi:hypothetical protein